MEYEDFRRLQSRLWKWQAISMICIGITIISLVLLIIVSKPESEYESRLESLVEENKRLKSDLEKLRSEYNRLKNEYERLMKEYERLKSYETKEIVSTTHIEETIEVKDWEITVLCVKEAEYIRIDDSFYGAKEGYKIVLVAVRIKNLGERVRSPDIHSFILVTDANKSYESIVFYTIRLERIWKPTEEIKSKAVVYKYLNTFVSLAPNTFTEGNIMFHIPKNEKPIKLYFRVGIIWGKWVVVKLRR